MRVFSTICINILSFKDMLTRRKQKIVTIKRILFHFSRNLSFVTKHLHPFVPLIIKNVASIGFSVHIPTFIVIRFYVKCAIQIAVRQLQFSYLQ